MKRHLLYHWLWCFVCNLGMIGLCARGTSRKGAHCRPLSRTGVKAGAYLRIISTPKISCVDVTVVIAECAFHRWNCSEVEIWLTAMYVRREGRKGLILMQPSPLQHGWPWGSHCIWRFSLLLVKIDNNCTCHVLLFGSLWGSKEVVDE